MDLSYWECQALRATGAMGGDRYADRPELACRPFDKGRDGFIFGECCGAVVVERLSAVSRNRVKPYAVLTGSATVMDAHRNPDPSLAGEIRVIENALTRAGLEPRDIDYVNPHGTGSWMGDEIEASAIMAAGLSHAHINATKSIVGHGFSAAGTVEIIATLLQMRSHHGHHEFVRGFVLHVRAFGHDGRALGCGSRSPRSWKRRSFRWRDTGSPKRIPKRPPMLLAVFSQHADQSHRERNAKMTHSDKQNTQAVAAVPPDDPARTLSVVHPDDRDLAHIAVVGDTYTVLLSGADTAGKFALIDMAVPHCGGPGPHRHDFEEMFHLLDGEIEFTFRGEKQVVKAGMTVNIPANAPHFFTNVDGKSARMLCLTAPAGQEEFFMAIGTPVATRDTPAPKMSPEEQRAFMTKAEALAPQYRTELLKP